MRRLGSSPRQTFVLFPLATLALDALIRGRVRVDARWLPVLALGYGLYRLAGAHRARRGGGEPGFASTPERLVTDGPYALSRNPMYLGHLVFTAGVVGATRSPFALVFALRQLARFRHRVAIDEERLARIFGDEYRAYRERVPRWLPLGAPTSRSGATSER